MLRAGEPTANQYVASICKIINTNQQKELLALLKEMNTHLASTKHIAQTLYRMFSPYLSDDNAKIICYEFRNLLKEEERELYDTEFGILFEQNEDTIIKERKRKYCALNNKWMENPTRYVQTKLFQTPPNSSNTKNISYMSTTESTKDKQNSNSSECMLNTSIQTASLFNPKKISIEMPKEESERKSKESLSIEDSLLKSANIQPKFNDKQICKDEEIKCSICFENKSEDRTFLKAKCGHFACDACWAKWLDQCLECPICKRRTRYKQLSIA